MPKRIYAIPGLGTTKELFRYLQIPDAEIIVPDWPPQSPHHTLKSYAAEFAKQIDTTSPFYLAGVSFGGMLSTELNEQLNPEKVFLISSCKYRSQLPKGLRFFKHVPVYKWIGEAAIRRMNARARHIIGFEKSYLPEFIAMMNSMPGKYYTHSINCIVKWDRASVTKSNIIQIHGNADKLLPIDFIKADHVIDRGTHAMIVNNAEEISAIIRSYL